MTCVARNEDVGAGGHGYFQEGRIVGVRKRGSWREGDHCHTLSLDLVKHRLDLVRGERELGAAQHLAVFRKNNRGQTIGDVALQVLFLPLGRSLWGEGEE